MKTNELTGAALDWAVAKCEGREFEDPDSFLDYYDEGGMRYSIEWDQGGPIIEREFIGLQRWNAEFEWAADIGGDFDQYGETPLIAAMRCYVASKLGDEVEIPEELTV